MQWLPAVGRDDIHAQASGWRLGSATCDQSDRSSEDPIEEITRLASQTRVVIINEAHDRPQHREFILQVAAALKDAGYNVIAAETFRPNIADTTNVSYASISDGSYVNEPVFGRLVRGVKAIGYELRDYELRHSEPSEESYYSCFTPRSTSDECIITAFAHTQAADRVRIEAVQLSELCNILAG